MTTPSKVDVSAKTSASVEQTTPKNLDGEEADTKKIASVEQDSQDLFDPAWPIQPRWGKSIMPVMIEERRSAAKSRKVASMCTRCPICDYMPLDQSAEGIKSLDEFGKVAQTCYETFAAHRLTASSFAAFVCELFKKMDVTFGKPPMTLHQVAEHFAVHVKKGQPLGNFAWTRLVHELASVADGEGERKQRE